MSSFSKTPGFLNSPIPPIIRTKNLTQPPMAEHPTQLIRTLDPQDNSEGLRWALSFEKNSKYETQFTTREGLYKLLPHSEYSRPNRVPFNSQGSNPVRVSFVSLNDQGGNGDRLCFDVGRELYFCIYQGVRKAADLSKPIDKRIYKGAQPTCHDFNHLTATAESVSLLVGFSAGQVQLIDPIKKEISKLFNEEMASS
uniref:WD repeat-containing protein 20-like n=1 Tax=Jaculus jaculus TaxID=51337 RepID=UPI001E1B1169|nr:WD repeat-containing protein 20-like [Jaculus jaculus]